MIQAQCSITMLAQFRRDLGDRGFPIMYSTFGGIVSMTYPAKIVVTLSTMAILPLITSAWCFSWGWTWLNFLVMVAYTTASPHQNVFPTVDTVTLRLLGFVHMAVLLGAIVASVAMWWWPGWPFVAWLWLCAIEAAFWEDTSDCIKTLIL
jgi:hypothetical protein